MALKGCASILALLLAGGVEARTVQISDQASYDLNRRATFAPGDVILFKRGGRFVGQFKPQGSGTPDKPIIVDAYGEGALPELTGDVVGERDDSGIITLVNQQGWEFHHLSISNGKPGPEVGYRSGILLFGDKPGTLNHFVIADCRFHDIYGSLTFMPQNGSGKFIGKHNSGVMFLISQGKGEVRVADLSIERNEFWMVGRQAISTRSVPSFTYGEKAFLTDPEGRFDNLVIRGNRIQRSAADGMIISNPVGALIEHNVVGDSGVGWDQYDRQVKNESGELVWARQPYVGLWAYNGTNMTLQYNEVYGTIDTQDGTAFDADRNSYGTVIQYNYSHDNHGGFFSTFGAATDTLIRYNVSINDHKRLLYFGFLETHDRRGIRTENNLFITRPGENTALFWGSNQTAPSFDNNVVIARGPLEWARAVGDVTATGPKKITDVGWAYMIESRGFEKGISARDNVFAGPGVTAVPVPGAGVLGSWPRSLPDVAPTGLDALAAVLGVSIGKGREALSGPALEGDNDFLGNPLPKVKYAGPFPLPR